LQLTPTAPYSPVEPVTEVLHGVPVTDPYRWLEDQGSPRTREWLATQTQHARAYLDMIPGRACIRERVRALLDVETYDSIHKAGNRYVFRKRMPGQEQPCIFMREGLDGPDQILIDPTDQGAGKYVAVKPILLSPSGQFILYETKEGGERTGTYELLNIQSRNKLPDTLPRGYLRGFAFAPDSKSFYYVHEAACSLPQRHGVVYRHVLGTNLADDAEIFIAGDCENLRLSIVPGSKCLGILLYRCVDKIRISFYLWPFDSDRAPVPLITNAEYSFSPLLLKNGRILAITDRDAPNSRIVEMGPEVCPRVGTEPEFIDIVPAGDSPIQNWIVSADRIFVSYLRNLKTVVDVFDMSGRRLDTWPLKDGDTTRLLGTSDQGDELFFEQESFTEPPQIWHHYPASGETRIWAARRLPFDMQAFDRAQVSLPARDGTCIPMFLVGLRDTLRSGSHATIMTSYGGYGVSMTPQFSVLVAFLIERGCLFALPNIRGGSEFGVEWHTAAKRHKRQVAFDDFLCAAEWLIKTGRTQSDKLAIFGGSNSGLLVGAAMTQRPDLFSAVLCMVPLLDMLRYHLFDCAHVWKDEFGTADDPQDLAALLAYSPYHRVQEGVSYPATMFVSGDADQNCNSLHARKMTARLQAANSSQQPIILDYSPFRGHSPVLPLSVRIDSLTDRLAFLCDQLKVEF
jgi:prolyl oligopeptidase